MSDDICGAECADGTPCQHPPNCPVPSHHDPDADNPHGRKFAIDESDHEDILEAARIGMSKAGCARAAGVDEKSLYRYLKSDENAQFRRAFKRARHKGERRLLTGPLEQHEEDPIQMDPQHARFLLSTSFDYVKTEKREVDANVDADVTRSLSPEEKKMLNETFDRDPQE